MELRRILPVRYWKTWNSHLVSFGQTRCFPRNPDCQGCPIRPFCPSNTVGPGFSRSNASNDPGAVGDHVKRDFSRLHEAGHCHTD